MKIIMGIKLKKCFVFVVSLCTFVFIFSSCASNPYKNDTRQAVDSSGSTVVERYGQLKVIGTNLCDNAGNPIQLRGMSSHGLQWQGKYANEDVLKWLRDDWNCQLWRAAMYLTQGGYEIGKGLKFKVFDSIEAAQELGIYCIADWHVMGDCNPQVYKNDSIEFFSNLAQTYGDKPNVIYEICNEPNGADVTWNEDIKPYAEEIIAAIRKYDPDNIIIVGTSTYSQDVDIAAQNPITGDLAKNVMYTLHFYAGTHGQELRDKAQIALNAGLPLFVTEWGTTKSSGDGGVFKKETLTWLSFLQNNNISWANWSLNNKGEDSGALKYGVDKFAKGGWKIDDLSESGLFVRSILRGETKIR